VIRAAQSHELACGGHLASSRQHGQAEATELDVMVYAVAVVEEFSHGRADKHGGMDVKTTHSLLSLGVNPLMEIRGLPHVQRVPPIPLLLLFQPSYRAGQLEPARWIRKVFEMVSRCGSEKRHAWLISWVR
jgi:hypothetical protein